MSPHRRARQATRIFGFGAITAGLVPFYVLHNALTREEHRSRVRDRWTRLFSTSLLALFGVTVEVEGHVQPPTCGRLVVANHRSTIDVGLLLRAFGGHVVARADLAQWPILGTAARRVGTVFVDRSSSMSGAAVARTVRDLLKHGETVLLFPEGRTFGDDEVHPFQRGSFVAAVHSGAEIVPVGLAYEHGAEAAFLDETFTAHLARMAATKKTRVVMCVGTPILVAPEAKAAELSHLARSAVERLVLRARARLSSPHQMHDFDSVAGRK